MLPLLDFVTLNTKMTIKRVVWLQFPRKIDRSKLYMFCDGLITRPEDSYRLWCVVVCGLETSWMRRPWPTGGLSLQKQTDVGYTCLHTLSVTYMLTGLSWLIVSPLRLPFCAASPRESNLLLSSSSRPPTLINSICPDIPLLLLTYHKEIARHAYRSMRPQLKKNRMTMLKADLLRTFRSLICDRTTTGLAQVDCSCQPCYFIGTWLLQSGIPRWLLFTTENAVELLSLKSLRICGPTKIPSLFFAGLDSWELLV